MRILVWILRIALFFLLFGFAIKNDQMVTLKFFLGAEFELRLVFVILAAFAVGALIGVSSIVTSLLRKRREIGRLKRDLARAG